jgi:ribosomal protein L3 glutamine methyltransferase
MIQWFVGKNLQLEALDVSIPLRQFVGVLLMSQGLSLNAKRNKIYGQFLEACRHGKMTVRDIIDLGHKLMRKQKLHHHFFGDFSLLANSKALTQYALAGDTSGDNAKLTVQQAEKIFALFERRIAEKIPVEYITHEAEYAGHKFYVNHHVLVPRSLMNTRFQDFLNQVPWENHRILDMCTGSGCIGITLALLHPQIHVDLADISPEALDVARINIEKHALSDRVTCVQSNLFENIRGKYDLIITNPPYVSVDEYNASPDEFKNEPKIALESGPDGLDAIKTILAQAKQYLNPNGLLIAEVGIPAAKRLKRQYRRMRFQWFNYRTPTGKEFLFNDPGVFLCRRADLPPLSDPP